MEEKRFYTTGEVAKLLNVDITTVWYWIKKGKINYIKMPGGQHKIPKREVERILRGENNDQ